MPQEEERLGANEMVERLTKDFIAMMPEREFSPAEILSFLVSHESATAALGKVQQSVDGQDKREKDKAISGHRHGDGQQADGRTRGNSSTKITIGIGPRQGT